MFNNLVSSRIISLIIRYLDENGIQYQAILEDEGCTKELLDNNYTWCSLRLFTRLAKLTNTSTENVFESSFSQDIFGADMSAVLRALGNPAPVFNHTESLLSSFISEPILKVQKLSNNSIEIRYIKADEGIELLTEYMVHILSMIPNLWGAKKFVFFRTQDAFIIEHNTAPKLFSTNETLDDYSPKLISEIIQSLQQSRKEIESKNRELEKKNKELSEAYNKLKESTKKQLTNEKMRNLGILATGIAHEINNPLGSVISNVEYTSLLLKNLNTNNDATINELLEVQEEIRVALYRIKNMVGDINLLAHSGGGDKTPSTLENLANSAVRLVSHKTKNITLETVYESKTTTLCSSPRITQVILNILTNAIHAIESANVKNGKILIHTYDKDNKTVIEITNNGGNVPDELLPKLSEPFFTTKEPGTGVGLGLAIVKQILDNHGAKLEFKNIDDGFKVKISFKQYKEQRLKSL